jgi:hypothetical protein
MTKKEHREGIVAELRALWADPYIKTFYAARIRNLALIARDMHNRRLNPRRPNWARTCTPGLRKRLRDAYYNSNLATEQIAQMYDVNQSRVSESVIGVRT